MDEREIDRPESLPQQLSRLGTSFGRLAFLNRARWVPVACLLAFVTLGAVQRLLASIAIAVGLGPWSIDLAVLFLGGVVGTAPVVLGLWTGAGAGSAAFRWGLGSVTLLLVSMTQFPRSDAGFSDPWFWIGFASLVQLWSLWASVGLLIRGLRFGAFQRTGRLRGPARVGIADLMLLTAAFAAGMGGNIHALELLSADQSVEVFQFDPIMQIISLPLWFLSVAIPLAPVLISSFQRGSLRPRAVVIGAVVSLALLLGVRFAMTAIFPATPGTTAIIWSPAQLLLNGAVDFGTVAGIIGVALVTRWAGYRIRRFSKRPTASFLATFGAHGGSPRVS